MKAISQFRCSLLSLVCSAQFLCAAENQEVWCECRQSGLMEIPVRMSISADGRVVALVEGMTRERENYRYETQLSPEEKAYLSTLLSAIDFMNRTNDGSYGRDSGNMELRVCQGGKTNLVYFNWLPENSQWESLGEFFSKLATQAEGMRSLQSGHFDCMAGDWLQREKVIEPLKSYLSTPKSTDVANSSFSILAKTMRAEEWVGLVALKIQQADAPTRDVLLYALCNEGNPISMPQRHREKLQQLLKALGESDGGGSAKQSRRWDRLFHSKPTDRVPAR